MKKFFILVALATCCALCASAQTKTAYVDLYQRGGARKLITTLMYDGNSVECGKMDLGQALNMLAKDGWVADQTLVGARRSLAYGFLFTRHKYHIILKKEYQPGEDPFNNLIDLKKKQVYKSKKRFGYINK